MQGTYPYFVETLRGSCKCSCAITTLQVVFVCHNVEPADRFISRTWEHWDYDPFFDHIAGSVIAMIIFVLEKHFPLFDYTKL